MLNGKVIAVTGGANGIGRAIAITAAAHGARAVIVGDLALRPKDGGETTIDLVKAEGADGVFVTLDVRNESHLEAFISASDAFGGLDCIVCNAGIARQGDGPHISPEDMDALFAINLKGALATAQAAIAAMKATGRGGSVIFISSMAGLKGTAINLGYGATKAGVNSLAAALADAHGPAGIRVNAICPGLIDTTLAHSSPPEVARRIDELIARMPLRRLGRPEEVGHVVAWLASDYSTYVTGVTLAVDGGQTAVL